MGYGCGEWGHHMRPNHGYKQIQLHHGVHPVLDCQPHNSSYLVDVCTHLQRVDEGSHRVACLALILDQAVQVRPVHTWWWWGGGQGPGHQDGCLNQAAR